MAGDTIIDGVPIPEDARVVAASEGIRGDEGRFLGTWAGTWTGDHRHVLIVEAVGSDGHARVVYAVADHPPARTHAAWRRFDARIVGRVLTIEGGAFTARYELARSGTLRAVYRRGDVRAGGLLWRTDLANLSAGGGSIQWTALQREYLETSLREDGKPVRLEVVLFRPEGNGPFPLLVFNHGSTGIGSDPKLFTETRWSFAVADFFMEKGWLVAFPERRGRGKSDGLYDEGFAIDRSQGYTCNPTRSLAGAHRALGDIEAAVTALQQRPEVAQTPILIGGVSRGGILSIAYAGRHPEQITGVINFVGGWVGEGCQTASEINGALSRQGAMFRGPTLWLYGRRDFYYSIPHSRANFDEFRRSGGHGTFVESDVPGPNGHALNGHPEVWAADVERFLKDLR